MNQVCFLFLGGGGYEKVKFCGSVAKNEHHGFFIRGQTVKDKIAK